jgi:hypothetical protein
VAWGCMRRSEFPAIRKNIERKAGDHLRRRVAPLRLSLLAPPAKRPPASTLRHRASQPCAARWRERRRRQGQSSTRLERDLSEKLKITISLTQREPPTHKHAYTISSLEQNSNTRFLCAQRCALRTPEDSHPSAAVNLPAAATNISSGGDKERPGPRGNMPHRRRTAVQRRSSLKVYFSPWNAARFVLAR